MQTRGLLKDPLFQENTFRSISIAHKKSGMPQNPAHRSYCSAEVVGTVQIENKEKESVGFEKADQDGSRAAHRISGNTKQGAAPSWP